MGPVVNWREALERVAKDPEAELEGPLLCRLDAWPCVWCGGSSPRYGANHSNDCLARKVWVRVEESGKKWELR